MILNNVRQHNCFIIQGSYIIIYMFRLIDQSSSGLFSRLSHKVLCTQWDPSVCTTRCCAHIGIPVCVPQGAVYTLGSQCVYHKVLCTYCDPSVCTTRCCVHIGIPVCVPQSAVYTLGSQCVYHKVLCTLWDPSVCTSIKYIRSF